MMTINNNNNDWSVPSSRMDRLKAKEQQKEAKKRQKKVSKKMPKKPPVTGPKPPKKKTGKKGSKKWLWIVLILAVLVGAIVFFVHRSSGNQAQASAEKIVQKSFNSDRDNITDSATSLQMTELAADAKKVRNNTEANQYSQLASLGKSAVAFRQKVENLKNGSNYRTSTTGTKVTSLLQDLKSSSFESDFSGFYSEYNKKLTSLEVKAKAVSKLHKQTNKLFKNGKSGALASTVTSSELNSLLDKLNKYPNFEMASNDLTRVEKAVKTYRKKQASESSALASSASSSAAAAASSSSAAALSSSSYSYSSYSAPSSSSSSYYSSTSNNSSSSSKASSTSSSSSTSKSSSTSASKSSSTSSKTASSSSKK